MKIVDVVVVDLTRPVEQKGFKKVVLVDCTQEISLQTVTSTKGLTGIASTIASSYFGNGGQYLTVIGKNLSATEDGSEITAVLQEALDSQQPYGVTLIMPKDKQKLILAKVKEFVEANEMLCVTEIVGTKDEVKTIAEELNSDRVAVFASTGKESSFTGLGAGVCGMGFPQTEGSITWANKVITGVQLSGYTLAEETELLDANINYLTEELGYTITQFGRTLSGSNIDITRSKDWLKNRIKEGLTYALVNSKKIPFTNKGLAIISSALDQVGIQAVQQDMLSSYSVSIPDISDIPLADKSNRVLRNVIFNAQLSGAVETISIELQITL